MAGEFSTHYNYSQYMGSAGTYGFRFNTDLKRYTVDSNTFIAFTSTEEATQFYGEEIGFVKFPGLCNEYDIVKGDGVSSYVYSNNTVYSTGSLGNVYHGVSGQYSMAFAVDYPDGAAQEYKIYFLDSTAANFQLLSAVVDLGANVNQRTALYTNTNDNSGNDYFSEMELSIPNGGTRYVAFAKGTSGSSGNRLFIYNINTGYMKYIAFPGTVLISGLEFSPSTDKLFFSTFASYSSGSIVNSCVGYVNMSDSSLNWINNTSDYKRSQLELGRDGKIYVHKSTADNKSTGLASIDPSSNSINASAVSFGLTSYVPLNLYERYYMVGQTGTTSYNLFPLPDQVDGFTHLSIDTVDDGRVWWSFDEPSIDDVIGVNNALGTVNTVSGKLGLGSSYNGSSDFTQVTDHNELDFGTGDLTIAAWIKTNSSNGTIIDKRVNVINTSTRGYLLRVYNGDLLFQLADGSGSANYYNTSAPAIDNNQWHHVAVTVDRDNSSGGKLFIDGSLVHTFNPTARSASLDNTSDLFIGKQSGGSAIYFNGIIDEVVMVGRVLSETDIQEIYCSGNESINMLSLMPLTGNEIEQNKQFSLSSYPNPFNPVTNISFSIPSEGMVTLKIFDISGREISTLVNEHKAPGSYNVTFNGAGFSSGVYFCRLQSGSLTQVKRIMLLK
jgi:hypothetical protein